MKCRISAVRRAARVKLSLSIGTALLGLASSGAAADATPIDFTYTGSLVDFTVPATGEYQIVAYGAQGGSGAYISTFYGRTVGPGGLGAEIGGDFSITAGEILQIAVGGAGNNPVVGGGPGGGGSFVVADNAPLIIAAGGGGGGANIAGQMAPGQGGLVGPDGGGQIGEPGGTSGNGGSAGGAAGGGGGGGFLTGGGSSPVIGGTGGAAFPDLTGGELGGGFGGGGGTSNTSGAGGGGGYSGGAGAAGIAGGYGPGYGGGSFDAGIDQILTADFNAGNGEVMITEIAVPEPVSLALFGIGLLGLGALWRRGSMTDRVR